MSTTKKERIGRVAVPGALLAASALAFGAMATPSDAAGADVTSRFQNSATVSSGGTPTHLNIGVSGKHTISAKMFARPLSGGTTRQIDCTLQVGADLDRAIATVPAGGSSVLALNVVTQLGGTVRLSCVQSGGNNSTELGFVKITAIKADTLDNGSIL